MRTPNTDSHIPDDASTSRPKATRGAAPARHAGAHELTKLPGERGRLGVLLVRRRDVSGAVAGGGGQRADALDIREVGQGLPLGGGSFDGSAREAAVQDRDSGFRRAEPQGLGQCAHGRPVIVGRSWRVAAITRDKPPAGDSMP
ncbi:hypothetical protein OG455_00285 [Kitasatospora sp. NBC_01287]|uniref:hypothetical protein n=1 Tax=Kitasatospora sp. NBC_01287 TaxID=2903573 RepID=UPI00224F6955|nr:hypothetical protein [Kitasatospora sp. NBC_01287]MCX4743963.1 hypothetical protein [Kitasatospora sp. NBC_01287]